MNRLLDQKLLLSITLAIKIPVFTLIFGRWYFGFRYRSVVDSKFIEWVVCFGAGF